MYIVARGRLQVGDAYREVGDAIPEAATWPNLLAYLHGGWITEVSDDAAPAAAAAETAEVAALAADTSEDGAPEGTAEEGEPAASEDEAAGPEPATAPAGETNTDRPTRSTRRRGR